MVTSKASWIIFGQLKKVWVRVVAFACLAAASVVMASVAGSYIPIVWTRVVNTEAIDQLLEIMASSMLAVTTFSLSVAVSAFTAAAQSATPRAANLLQQDPTTQNVLSTFLGAFIFSLVALLALNGGFYSETGVVVLFATTALVLLLVLLAFLRWIAHLMTFGRIADTLDRVEAAAASAISLRQSNPFLGGRRRDDPVSKEAYPILSDTIGYVQHVDMQSLSDAAETDSTKIWVNSVPGDYVHKRTVLAFSERKVDENTEKRIRSAFSCDRERDFEQDPRFGIIVLSEIASKALSPAVNDPGTAIDVIGRLVRVIAAWRDEIETEPQFERVFVPPIQAKCFLEDGFDSISRDSAGILEVHARVQNALSCLSEMSPDTFKFAATEQSKRTLLHAQNTGLLEADLNEVKRLALA